MGNTYIQNRIKNNWEVVSTEKDYKVVRDNSGREGQEYHLTVPLFFKADEQLQIYNQRRIVKEPIVRCLGAQYKANGLFCNSSEEFRVITERIQYRFNQIKTLPFLEIMYILNQSLLGYQFLYRKVGFFNIHQNMIGFSSEGQVRVWHHQNFSINIPQFPRNSIRTVRKVLPSVQDVSQEEILMIRQIFGLIENKSQSKYPHLLRQYANSTPKFSQGISLIHQIIRQDSKILPNRIDGLERKIKNAV